MERFTPLHASEQTISAQYYPDEHLVTQQDSVGLYDGKEKAPAHYDGRIYLTSHRILFLNSTKPHLYSVALDLSLVRQTEYWAGFLKSNPKITLLLAPENTASNGSVPSSGPTSTASTTTTGVSSASSSSAAPIDDTPTATSRNWICRVCGMANVPSSTLGSKCSLCGVARDKLTSTTTVNSPSTTPSRSSTPRPTAPRTYEAARGATPPPLPPPPPKSDDPIAVATGATPTVRPRVACPVCTFLNHHSMSNCEMCETPLPSLASAASATTPSRPSTPATTTSNGAPFVRLSFRKGGVNTFYTALKEALVTKAWDLDRGTKVVEGGKKEGGGGGGGGIDAIMSRIDLDSKERDDSLEDALQDLESLMAKAKEMILLAQSMSARLAPSPTSPSSSTPPSEADKTAASTLLSFGLLPEGGITSDLASSTEHYHHELAKELASLLQGGVGGKEKERMILGLDEVWCAWNRARGVSLIPPPTLLSALRHLPLYTSPSLTLTTFPSSLTLLLTPLYSLPSFSHRLLSSLDLRTAMSLSSSSSSDINPIKDGMTTLEIAQEEGVSLRLAKELLEGVEMERGELARDEQGGEGTRWFRNGFQGFVWDGTTVA